MATATKTPWFVPTLRKHEKRILGWFDLRITRRGRRIGVVTFDRVLDARTFYRDLVGAPWGSAYSAVVVSGEYVESGNWFRDTDYICLMLFLRKHLTFEVIMHESLHAAFRWAEQTTHRFDPDDEEQLAYAAGRIAEPLVAVFRDAGLLP